MPEPDLIIEVEGGVVTAVHTNLSVTVAVCDHDAGVEKGAVGVVPLAHVKETRTSSARAEQVLPARLGVGLGNDRERLGKRKFAQGWTKVPQSSGEHEWLLWIGPLMRARVIRATDTDVYHASLETLIYDEMGEFTSLSEAQGWCEQQITEVLAETRAVIELIRTPGVCSRLFGRRLL